MSVEPQPLQVVFCWHMHQPDYRGPDHSDYKLPWVYLHGIKDYVDMVAHLENNPDARAVVNFAPVLLEQLEDYARQIRLWLEQGVRISDPLLSALAGPGLPLDQDSRRELIRACLRANKKYLIERFPTYLQLTEMAESIDELPESSTYFNDQYLVDLLVWYHLVWMGEFSHNNDLRVRSLEKKRKEFNADDRRRLVETIGELLSGVVVRYRRLAERGQVELSVTPYAHPILPLLLDIESASEALPDVVLPEPAAYPGGESRVRWHIRRGIKVFEQHFGFRPQGCWPSEGGVDGETLRLLEEEGFRWAASGQQVLHNSLSGSQENGVLPENWVHQPYRFAEGKLNCFFRDDGLSDLIGFTYADWHSDDAVGNLIQHLETIADATAGEHDRVVSIIMDGENAWEHYPRNGYYFLETLYKKLAEHPRLQLTTFSDAIQQQQRPAPQLSRLVAGSWVYGTFSTWIGNRDKNCAWEMLTEAKKVYDRVMANGCLDESGQAEAELQLATCEGSDWFWWFGDYNPGATVADFERLFRQQLSHLYEILGEEPPEHLSRVFSFGGGDAAMGGVMRKN